MPDRETSEKQQDPEQLYQQTPRNPEVVQARLTACLAKWRLQSRGELSGGFRAAVFDCISATGEDAVLKLPPTSYEASAEAAALRQWESTGAALRLIDFDPDQQALLLARLRPGTPFAVDDEAAVVEVVSDVLTALHQSRPSGFQFLRLNELYPSLEQRALTDNDHERGTRNEPRRGEEARRRMPAASRQAARLSAGAADVLLHGDILDKNLLWNGSRYLASDPIPRLGDPCSDVGFFAAGHRPAAPVFERASSIARRMNLDPGRAARWAAVWLVHQACQAWRDDQPELDALCASAELQSLLAD